MHRESRALNEFPPLARRWRPQLNHPFIYFNSARPWRNTTQVQIHCNLTIKLFSYGLYTIPVTELKINHLILQLELPFQMIIKQQANYAKAALSVRIHSLVFIHSFKWTVWVDECRE